MSKSETVATGATGATQAKGKHEQQEQTNYSDTADGAEADADTLCALLLFGPDIRKERPPNRSQRELQGGPRIPPE